jgi:hypothetical protein
MEALHNAPLHNVKVMNRFELTRRLVAKLRDEAVIGGIGNSNFDLWATGRRPQNFYMLGSMGLAAPIALGFAIAQPHRKVFALEGDGSLLMQLGCLSTIAARAPRNLAVILWDNGIYQITGSQPTPAAAARTDFVAVARASGIAQSHWAADEAEFEGLVDASLPGTDLGSSARRSIAIRRWSRPSGTRSASATASCVASGASCDPEVERFAFTWEALDVLASSAGEEPEGRRPPGAQPPRRYRARLWLNARSTRRSATATAANSARPTAQSTAMAARIRRVSAVDDAKRIR